MGRGTDNRDLTPAHDAARAGQADCIELLCELCADLDCVEAIRLRILQSRQATNPPAVSSVPWWLAAGVASRSPPSSPSTARQPAWPLPDAQCAGVPPLVALASRGGAVLVLGTQACPERLAKTRTQAAWPCTADACAVVRPTHPCVKVYRCATDAPRQDPMQVISPSISAAGASMPRNSTSPPWSTLDPFS
eukprot:gene1313-biopygen2387